MGDRRHGGTAGHAYLARYPKMWKWMNQCVGCQRVGYKPDLPGELPRKAHGTMFAQNVRRFFEPLALDDQGMCDQCDARDA